MITRRQLLAAGGGVVATLLGTAPIAHADATLPGWAEVWDVQWVDVDDEHGIEAEALSVTVQSQADQPIDPVIFVWGRYNWMMQSWTIVEGPDRIPSGAKAQFRIEAPEPETRVYPDQTAQLSVIDRGTPSRIQTQFNPVEVDGVEFF